MTNQWAAGCRRAAGNRRKQPKGGGDSRGPLATPSTLHTVDSDSHIRQTADRFGCHRLPGYLWFLLVEGFFLSRSQSEKRVGLLWRACARASCARCLFVRSVRRAAPSSGSAACGERNAIEVLLREVAAYSFIFFLCLFCISGCGARLERLERVVV